MAKKDFNVMPGKVDHIPIVKRKKYWQALVSGDYPKVISSLTDILAFFERIQFTSYCPEDLARVDEFVATAFNIITDPNLKISELDGRRLVACSHLFSNIVAVSSYLTTDAPLIHVLRQDSNLPKVLFLLNARNSIRLDPEIFFNIDASIATLWYNTYVLGTSNPTELMQRNLLHHLTHMDERWCAPNPKVSVLYFACTYLAPGEDRRVKGIMNKSCKAKLNIKISNNPNPKKIAIATAKWRRNHAVYKSSSPLVDQLKAKYDLTLLHLGNSLPEDLITEGFDRVGKIEFEGMNMNIPDDVINNEFAAVYFPDIGMNDESLWLSNCRLAPVQVMGYGHPATAGDNSEIDYFIGGDIEKDVADRYAEQMVLIPGLAQSPVWPSYERQNSWKSNDKVVINCVWGPDKYNYTMLKILQEVSRRATMDHVWHFYPSPGVNRYAGLLPFISDIKQTLPDCVVHFDKEYFEYMEAAEKGDFAVNSFPFGGYNTVIESLYLGLPVMTLEGDRFYNRAASYLLRKIGLGDLSHTMVEEFIDGCVHMIDATDYRLNQREKLSDIDLKSVLFEEESTHFLEAFDYILANHPIKSDKPILIGV